MSRLRRAYRLDLHLFVALYQGYLRLLTVRASTRKRDPDQDQYSEVPLPEPGAQPRSFEEADFEANELGNQFRGLGIAVGLLGVVIVFLAVAPIALHLEDETNRFVGLLKVVLMLVMVFLIWFFGVNLGLRDRWIRARREAERLRYRELHDTLSRFRERPNAESEIALRKLLGRILDPKTGQIAYNEERARTYLAIEERSDQIAWVGFAFTLIAAVALMAADFNWLSREGTAWLVFGTTLLPAMIATVHGINGFLMISVFADQHTRMAQRLSELHQSLLDTPLGQPQRLSDIADWVYRDLVDRDVQWEETAKKLGIKPS